MDSRQDRLKEILAEAVARNDATARAAYLDEACAGDGALRAEVEALALTYDEEGDFVEKTLVGSERDAIAERPGTVIGRYKLLQEIGEGGFGVVFMAEQIEPVQRKVALKIIKAGMDTREVIARFEAERQALALMDHPNIARVLDAGATESGRPYFVMELVKGVKITDYCDQNHLSTEERLKLFISVCHAIQHAHQKGIIHRDLKPSNVMVTLHDGEAVPKVIDFGIAKATGQRLTSKTLFTRYEQMVGTPAYMSPEQAAMSGLDIDTRTDIYALGVLLYELLTGVTPFDKATLARAALDEVRRMIRETEPPKPSTRLQTLARNQKPETKEQRPEVSGQWSVVSGKRWKEVRGDLDWIVMKALEKDRRRRYETANDFAEDIQRHLKHEPVVASPPSTTYRLCKFIQRNKVTAAGAALVAVALVVAAVASVVAARYFRNQERVQRRLVLEKEEQQRLARESLYFAHIRVAHQDWHSGQIPRALNSLGRYVPRTGEPDLRGWEWYYLLSLLHGRERTLQGHTGGVASVSAHPNGRWVASGERDSVVRIWDAESGEVLAQLKGHKEPVRSVAWSSDGSLLASGGFDGELVLWDGGSFQKRVSLDCEHEIWAIAWSPDGKRIAAGGLRDDDVACGRITIWDVASGQRLRQLKGNDMYWSLAWHPAGKVLVSGGNVSGNLEVWDVDTGQLLKTVGAHDAWIRALAWSPNGRQLVSGSGDQRIRIWSLENWEKVREIEAAHAGIVLGLAWSPDGKVLVSGGNDRLVKFWDPQTGSLLKAFRGHLGAVCSVCWWSKQGLVLSAGGRDDGIIRMWNPNAEQAAHIVPGMGPLAWSPDGGQLAITVLRTNTAERAVAIAVLDAATWHPLYYLQPGTNIADLTPRLLAWSPNGQTLAIGFDEDLLQVWDLVKRKEMLTLAGTNNDERPLALAWSPDGQMLLTACLGGLARIWSVEEKRCVFTFRGHADRPRNSPLSEGHDHVDNLGSACWNADGRRIASGDQGGGVLIWEASNGRILHRLWCAGGGYQVSFSPGGDLLAAGDEEGAVRIWDAGTGREIHALRGHPTTVSSLSWSPDGRRLATASEDGTTRIWDAVSGQELLVLASGPGREPCLAWSSDGRRIGTAGNEVRIFDASVGYELGSKMTPGSARE